MKASFCLGFITLTAVLVPATILAQTQQPTHAPDGGTREGIQSIVILPKTGAPFSAVVVTEWTRLLDDGTSTTIKNHRIVARDSTGRIFEERRYFSPTGDKVETPLSNLQYSDPDRHEYYNCVPTAKVCTLSAYYEPASVTTDASAGIKLPQGTIHEDLGQQRIYDLDAIGTRETTTINYLGAEGNPHPEALVKEFWYSPWLEINVIVKRQEPRGGKQSFAVQNIDLTEPDPKLFIPPADYRVIDMRQSNTQ
jgi:hypothetical protein